MSYAHTLKIARMQKNLSQSQLAYVADVSAVTISKIENGLVANPHSKTKEKIEEVLGPVDWQLTFDEGQAKRQILMN